MRSRNVVVLFTGGYNVSQGAKFKNRTTTNKKKPGRRLPVSVCQSTEALDIRCHNRQRNKTQFRLVRVSRNVVLSTSCGAGMRYHTRKVIRVRTRKSTARGPPRPMTVTQIGTQYSTETVSGRSFLASILYGAFSEPSRSDYLAGH